MKFWNKRHRVRQAHWHRFELTPPKPTAPGTISYRSLMGGYRGWMVRRGFHSLKRYLQQVDSPGRFYMTIMVKEVWFERAEDLTIFALLYSGAHDFD